MIFKSYEINKINFEKIKFILIYGSNEGHKKEIINEITKKLKEHKIDNYDEKNILSEPKIFYDNILSKSFFEKEKIILINRASEKIVSIIESIAEKKLEDLIIVINSDILEKKSKLRLLFEKTNTFACIAFYQDNIQTLSRLAYAFFKEKKITISQENINLIVSKCNGDRGILKNELNKIEMFAKKGKKVTKEYLSKLINLSENHSISELIDNCLSKNKNKTLKILNENNFSNEDCILITKIFLNKSKKLLRLTKDYEKNKNIELTISSSKPPIFWKDKDIIRKQIYEWSSKNIYMLIYKLNEIELKIKKNINNSIYLMVDFIIEQTGSKTNNKS